MPNTTNGTSRTRDFFADTAGLDKAMGKAMNGAQRMHKLLGFPIVVCRDGKVVWIPPEEIELLPEENGQEQHD
jgi:hypothetical protein